MEPKNSKNKGRSPLLVSLLGTGMVLSSCAQPVTFKGHIKDLKVTMELAAHATFLAGRRATEEVSYSFLPDSASQTMHLKATPPRIVNLQQLDRKTTVDSFVQGHQGDSLVETFTVSTLDKLDLLLVVDNSSSMAQYQQKLSAGLVPLLSHISNTDWQIMVTTTSPDRKRNPMDPAHPIKTYGCPRVNGKDPNDKVIISRDDYIKNSQSIDAKFIWKVLAGETGDPVEHGLLAAVSALDGECGDSTRSWTRPDAQKVVLMLTDEENCGSDPDQNCDTDLDADPNFFLSRAPGAKLFALLHDLDRYTECVDEGYVRKPDDYRFLIAKTGGMEGNICEGHYDTTLEEISRNMHPVNRKEFPLLFKPEQETLKMEIDGRPWSSNFNIVDGKIRFETPLPAGAKMLSIAYNHDPKPLSSKFPLSTSIDASTLSVMVNGSSVDASRYKVEDNQILFDPPPPALAKINVDYRVGDALPQYFPLARDALMDTVTVTVDNKPVSDFQVIGDENREVILTEPPRDGVPILISYETAESRTVRYPALTYNQDRIVQVAAFDGLSREVLAMEWQGAELVFKREDIAENRVVEVIYTLAPGSKELALTLAQKPKDGSLSIVSSSGSDCVANVNSADGKLLFPCPAEQLGRLHISYDYFTQIDKSFKMNGNFAPDAVWKVKINGVETKDFKYENNTLSFSAQQFDASTSIEVEVWQPLRS